MNNNNTSPPLLSTLSPSIQTMYTSCGGADRKTFKRLYLAVWRFLWPLSRYDAVVLAYAIPGVLKKLDAPGLCISDWFMLSRLFMLTSGGSHCVDSRNVPFTVWDREVIRTLMQLGYVIRTSFDPAHPRAVKPSHISKTYISLTPSGIAFFRVVVEKISRAVRDDTLNASTGRKRESQ